MRKVASSFTLTERSKLDSKSPTYFHKKYVKNRGKHYSEHKKLLGGEC